MGAFDGVKVNQVNGGLQRKSPSTDGVMLLVIAGAVAATGLAVKTALKLLTLKNAEDAGINAGYDDTNNIHAHYHIDEFFRVAPQGTLYVVLDNGTLTSEDIKVIIRKNSEISGFAIARNDATTIVDFPAYKGAYQNIITELRAENHYVSFGLVEGNDSATATIGAFPDNRADSAPDIATVSVQDPIIRALKTEYEGLAAVGTALGGMAVRKVNENLGSVNIESKPDGFKGNVTYPLTNVGRQRWLGAVLLNGMDVEVLSAAEKADLDTKAHIYAGSYVGLAGIFFNNSGTGTVITSDFAYLENNRVWNKAARAIRQALLPRVKSNVLKDPETGFILEREAKELEVLAENALQVMEAAEEISGKDVYINPEQAIAQDVPLEVRAEVVSNGILFDITVNLGQVNSIG